MIETIKTLGHTIWKITSFYLIWITIHYVAAHLYPRLCAPLSLTGFLISPFVVETPWCASLRWLINEGSGVIKTMWIVLGTWLCSKFIRIPPKSKSQPRRRSRRGLENWDTEE